jgi:hypothetical protein
VFSSTHLKTETDPVSGTQCFLVPLGDQDVGRIDNMRMDLGEVGWGDVDWIGLAQDSNRWRALVNSVLNLRVP